MYVSFNVPQNIITDVHKRIAGHFQLLPAPSNRHNKIEMSPKQLCLHNNLMKCLAP